ncbi:helix-turn-helix domain-containing protein [Salibacterium halotolerans]|uniref:Transcriptional regulator, contains XRE-family HTH domain n=1 Tax=Salibacterium halotolerans TaxID=1884432 RepID=A0A1I5MIH2_9BACI|nr:helix-turn-helix transcriptional regulator [Salibacterium halotolerans]SFP09385.1 Transcriptional regulator, contains XRE-family HTH domain [Salibacterium halotolerans]
MIFQEKLRTLRKEKKMTQQDVANKLGMTRQAYGYYESLNEDKREPNHDTTVKLAEIFDVSTDYLLGKSKENDPSIEEYDPLAELRQFMIDNGLENESVNFYDIEEWKKLSPEDVQDIINHYKYKLWQASQRKNEKNDV